MEKLIKQTAKKIAKSGFFSIIDITKNSISFKNVYDNVFSLQILDKPFKGCGLFRAGYVRKWTEYGATFESDFKSLGTIEKADFRVQYQQTTDNPDFILRQAKYFTLN